MIMLMISAALVLTICDRASSSYSTHERVNADDDKDHDCNGRTLCNHQPQTTARKAPPAQLQTASTRTGPTTGQQAATRAETERERRRPTGKLRP